MGFLNGPEAETVDAAGVPTIMPGPSPEALSTAAREPLVQPQQAYNVPSIASGGSRGGGGPSRQSLINILGRLADVGATIGGTPALYQSGIDANTARENEVTDRDQKAQLFAQQLAKNNQQFEAGNLELDQAHLVPMQQAARGLKTILAKGGVEGVKRAWPLYAQQLKIPADQLATFGQMLSEDPENAVNSLDAALNPVAAQSPSKEVQVYNMLKERDPTGKLAEQYLAGVADPKAITDFQEQSLGIQRDRNALTGELGRGRLEIAREAARAKAAAAKAKEGGGDTSSLTGLLHDVRKNYNDLDAEGAMVQQGGDPGRNIVARVRASGLGQLAEGAVGTRAQTYRDNIKNSRPGLVQAIKAATGMTSKQLDSNADMKLALQQATDPTQSIQSNRTALDRLERLVKEHKPAAPPPRRNLPLSRSAPAASGGWKLIGSN